MKVYGKFAIFAAVFFLLCSFAVPNFVRAESANEIVAEKFSRATAHTCQDFVLLVAEKFIDGVKNSPRK